VPQEPQVGVSNGRDHLRAQIDEPVKEAGQDSDANADGHDAEHRKIVVGLRDDARCECARRAANVNASRHT
jgi:hypothetical protein